MGAYAALYLSVKEKRPFLDRLNWTQPFSGTLQAVAFRTFNIGLYFPLESFFHEVAHRYLGTCPAVDPHSQSELCRKRSEASRGPKLAGSYEPSATARQEESQSESYQETARSGTRTGSGKRFQSATYNPGDLEEAGGQHPSDSAVIRPHTLTLFIAGNLAGVTCACISHPLSVTKYAHWNGNGRGFWGALRQLYCQGGAATFYRGFVATMARDSLFGGVYSCLRHHLMCRWGVSYASSSSCDESFKGHFYRVLDTTNADGKTLLNGFVLNTLAACVAVAASSPLNYVRNMQFAAPLHAAEPHMFSVLRGLCEQVAHPRGGLAKFAVLSRSLLLGWGSLRAAVGMGFGSLVYDFCENCAAILG